MKYLFAPVLAKFPLMNLVCTGEVIFFLVFLAALVWVFRKGSKNFYKELSNLPTQEGGSHE